MFDASKIGQSFPPYTIEVERGKVRELALAIGDEKSHLSEPTGGSSGRLC